MSYNFQEAVAQVACATASLRQEDKEVGNK